MSELEMLEMYDLLLNAFDKLNRGRNLVQQAIDYKDYGDSLRFFGDKATEELECAEEYLVNVLRGIINKRAGK